MRYHCCRGMREMNKPKNEQMKNEQKNEQKNVLAICFVNQIFVSLLHFVSHVTVI